MEKKLSDEDEDEVSDAVDFINTCYEKNFKKPKKADITPEQLEEMRKEKRTTYLKSLPEARVKTYKEACDKDLEKYGLVYKDLIGKATRIGMDIILSELHKLSTDAPKTCVERKDGTKGADHIYYLNAYPYKKDEDGKDMTITMNSGKKDFPAVILDKPEAKAKNLWTFSQVSDPEEFMSLESVCKDTNDDGLKQIYAKPMTFTNNPEWNGTGCKCETTNKKFNLFLHKYEDGVWKKHIPENPPAFCCNGKVDSNGRCKRHNKSNLKNVVEWTSLGAGWASVKV